MRRTSSPTAAHHSICPGRRPATLGIPRTSLAARRPDQRQRWQQAWFRPVSDPTPAVLFAARPGSVRIAGLKPTYGLVSRAGVLPNSYSYDHCGPMARTSEDCALILNVVAGHDPADPASSPRPAVDYAADINLGNQRLAYRRDPPFLGNGHSRPRRAACGFGRRLSRLFRELGAMVDTVSAASTSILLRRQGYHGGERAVLPASTGFNCKAGGVWPGLSGAKPGRLSVHRRGLRALEP